MKKIIKHALFSTSIFFMAFTTMPTALPSANLTALTVEAEEISPRADQIYWRYRMLSDGTIQKRRWNATKGYWVDPHWINVN